MLHNNILFAFIFNQVLDYFTWGLKYVKIILLILQIPDIIGKLDVGFNIRL